MQGQKRTISSLPETLNFEHGSTSRSAAVDQQPCWNNIRNTVQGQLPECLLSPDDTSIRYMDSVRLEQQEIRSWSLGTTPSVTLNDIGSNEMKTDHGWLSPMTACASSDAGSEERWHEQNSLFIQGANSDTTHHDINLNEGLAGDIDNSHQVMGHSNLHKSSRLEKEQVLPASSSRSFALSSGGGESLMPGYDGQPGGPFLCRRTSCKRKTVEENAGQPSTSASPCYLGQAESSPWPGSSAQFSEGISTSALAEHVSPSLEIGARVPAVNRIPNPTLMASLQTSHTHRNVRARTNPLGHQESPTPSLLSSGSTARHSVSTSLPRSSRSIRINHSLNMMTAPVAGNVSDRNPNMAVLVPALPQNMQSLRLNIGSGSRPIALSSPSISGDTRAVPLHQRRPRRTTRNMLDHPLFVPTAELRHSNQTPTNICPNGANNVTANVATVSLPQSSSGANLSRSPSWVLHSNPNPLHSRRFSELVRRSLLSYLGAESSGQNSVHTSLPPGPHASPGDMVFPSGAVNRALPRLHPRSVSVLERHGDGVLGIPESLQTLAAGSEGRNHLVISEIRNVLDLMRRGQNLPLEDIVILDQPVFFGVADIHDRHRDMRLDVDNMSYEELLALEERIGNVCTGLDEDTIFKHLKQHKYNKTPGVKAEAEPCCICQEEYNVGEDLGTLECGHGFHTNCIKQWLMHKNLCPICKTTGLTK